MTAPDGPSGQRLGSDGPSGPRSVTGDHAALRQAAAAHGVTTAYHDGIGNHHEVPESTLRAVLTAMGVDPDRPAARPDDPPAESRGPEGPLEAPPVLVARAGRPASWSPPDGEPVWLRLESGQERELPGGPLPTDLPLGYHELRTQEGAARTRLIVAPPACWLPPACERGGRLWGWTLQLYALRSAASWGIGDLRDLDELLRAGALTPDQDAATAGADGEPGGDGLRTGPGFALVNPLHAADPGQASPYLPSSRVFRNPLYLHVEAVPEVARLDLLERTGFEQFVNAGRRLNQADRIDRAEVHRLKDAALRLCHTALERSPARRAELDAFTAATPELGRFATFRALQQVHGGDWRVWPAELRRPDSPAVARFAADHAGEVSYHAYLQWLLHTQFADLPRGRLGVLNDLAIGFDPGGFDAWTFQDSLAHGITVGAPPDALGPAGQNWGLPALVPARLAAAGYHPFVQTVRAGLADAGGLRIDHVMGLFRLFWIPEGAPASDGTYVRYPAEDLLGIVALESHRAQALVVGEDLGTVEPGVRERLAAERVLSYRVAWFERDERGPRPAGDYPRLALATATTHDLPTVHGFFSGADLAEQRELGLVAPEAWEGALAAQRAQADELHRLLQREGVLAWWEHDLDTVTEALYAFLARSPAMLVGVSLDDVAGARARPNIPGTVHERPNWSLPLPLLLDDLLADPPGLAERIRRLGSLLRGTGR